MSINDRSNTDHKVPVVTYIHHTGGMLHLIKDETVLINRTKKFSSSFIDTGALDVVFVLKT